MPYDICDTHCDTISTILNNDEKLYKNNGHIDIHRLKGQNFLLQVFAAWIDPKYAKNGFLRCSKILDKFEAEYKENSHHLQLVRSPEEIYKAKSDNKVAVMLAVEGGEALDGNLDNLYRLYQRGVRLLTLTWNGRNLLADGVGVHENAGGLTPFGQQVVNEMNKLGMIVDVSHLAEKGFWDVAEFSNSPFIASHSNAKSVCNHPRNLTDKQINHLIQKGGFIGLNFYPSFLSKNTASISDIIKHIEYFLSMGSQDIIGFGADFDGVDNLPNGISGVENMQDVIEEMLKLGYSEQLIKKIASQNAIRVIKEIMN